VGGVNSPCAASVANDRNTLAHKNKTANVPFAYVREVNMTSLAAPETGRFFSGETGSMSDERMMPAAAVIVAAGAGAVRLLWLL
jgi:hypothetical protein